MIHGILLEPSLNLFLSWLLVGLWVIFTIITIAKIRTYRQFNSPHNTSFFVLGVPTIGLFYLYCGYYSELSNFYLFTNIQYFPSVSAWILIFSVPYLLYSLYSLFICIKKFRVVYIYKDRSLDAKKFSLFYLIWIFICNIIFVVIIISRMEMVLFTPVIVYPGLELILYNIFIFILIVYSIVKIRSRAAAFSRELIAQRRAQIESIQNTPVRVQRTTSSSRSSKARQQKRSTKTKPKSKPKPKHKQTPKSHTLSKAEKKKLFQKVQSMRPKTSKLTIDDFKCIFCFSLPQYPKDQGKGIVLCPHCNYPAHADEFKEWVANSKLCSRCGSELPSSFRRNPRIISVKFYTRVIQYFRKKEKF
ncbi:MAG: hypothetical protein EU547_06005 [Promethearchaeota archaeon]|nr:MAG: hypothetical protein EU547_06005 [Candidatus Lokiarchaeota archaeon]